jgi:hypothetical protein
MYMSESSRHSADLTYHRTNPSKEPVAFANCEQGLFESVNVDGRLNILQTLCLTIIQRPTSRCMMDSMNQPRVTLAEIVKSSIGFN